MSENVKCFVLNSEREEEAEVNILKWSDHPF